MEMSKRRIKEQMRRSGQGVESDEEKDNKTEENRNKRWNIPFQKRLYLRHGASRNGKGRLHRQS